MSSEATTDMLLHEERVWQSGTSHLAGVDEAGRGPLAGPVVAAAVCIEPDLLRQEANGLFDGLTDSKKLSARRREHFFDLLYQHPAVSIGVGQVEAEEIDVVNILKATHRAMAAALHELSPLPEFALVDGSPVQGLPVQSEAVVQGDSQSLLIAAASVVAKVTRDRIMVEYDEVHPGYGFSRHKGYGTAAHLEALRQLGPSPCHRRSFTPVAQQVFDW